RAAPRKRQEGFCSWLTQGLGARLARAPGGERLGEVAARGERLQLHRAKGAPRVEDLEHGDRAALEGELGGLRAALRGAEERGVEALDALRRRVEVRSR